MIYVVAFLGVVIVVLQAFALRQMALLVNKEIPHRYTYVDQDYL